MKPRGKPFPKGHKNWNAGKKWSEETKKKISDSHKRLKNILSSIKNLKKVNNCGKNNWAWKGGITPINIKIRNSLEYKLWQDSVKNRDGNICQKCGENRVGKIMAHHILNFDKHIELRFAIDNGITFCRPCHKMFHIKYGFRNNNREQLLEFLK